MLQFMNNFMPTPLMRYPRPSRPFVPTHRRGVNNTRSRPVIPNSNQDGHQAKNRKQGG